ncbi:MAG: hypothetical protein RMJ98_04845 [Myxococcales bacterium]|nr:hypothetical protein [Polyangiaceae bacterium]MDW8248620.1 hypothetical protein [Myxococcales bacterium]
MFHKFLTSLGVLHLTLLALTLFLAAFVLLAVRALGAWRDDEDKIAALPLLEDDHVR